MSAKFDAASGHDHDGVDSKKIPALSTTYFDSLNGAGLTNLNGSQITTGTVPFAQIPATLTGKDADTVDTFHASTTPGQNVIPVGGAGGKLANDVDRVDGYHASAALAPDSLIVTGANSRFPWGTKPSVRGALVSRTSSQLLSLMTNNLINFNNEIEDTDAIHDNTTNSSRLTVPTGVTRVRLSGNLFIS